MRIAGSWHARWSGSGRKTLDELGVALDPDDQSELDWLTRELFDEG